MSGATTNAKTPPARVLRVPQDERREGYCASVAAWLSVTRSARTMIRWV